MKILLAVDGSEHSERVTAHVVRLAQGCADHQVLLLNVQTPIAAPEVLGHMPASEIEAMQQTRGGDAMAAARSILDAAGIRYEPAVAIGDIAEVIVQHANDSACDAIVVGTHGAGALRSALTGSVATEVIRHAGCPVTVVK